LTKKQKQKLRKREEQQREDLLSNEMVHCSFCGETKGRESYSTPQWNKRPGGKKKKKKKKNQKAAKCLECQHPTPAASASLSCIDRMKLSFAIGACSNFPLISIAKLQK
jgi:hypothetical protein